MYRSSLIEEDKVQRYGNIFIILFIVWKINYLFSSFLSCLLWRYAFSFNFKMDTEVAGSSILNILFTLFHLTLDLYIKVLSGGGVMIKNIHLTQCATGSKILNEPEPDRIGITFGRNRTGTGPDYKPEKVNRIGRIDRNGRIFNGFLNFNTQLTSHKHKHGSFNFEIWVEGEGQDTSRHF